MIKFVTDIRFVMRLLAIIFLYPLSLIYATVVALRNKFYDWKIFKSFEFTLPVITVGNITVGGTGKTPHTELLVSLLKDRVATAVLSRGYKRKTKGFHYVEITDTVAMAGDEPLQMKRKFPEVTFAVDADRVAGIRRLQREVENLGVVILDDAYQHRRVRPSLSLLMVDYTRPVTEDHYLPYGRLRDSLSQKHRADVVVVTKCPSKMQPIEQRLMTKKMNLYPYQHLYFTGINYGFPRPVFSKTAVLPHTVHEVIAITGIANPVPFIEHLTTFAKVIKHLDFPDHHVFTRKDIKHINALAAAHPGVPIFTTEKDAQRLQMINECSEQLKKQLFYVPIKVAFLSASEGEKFSKFITDYVQKNKRNTILHR